MHFTLPANSCSIELLLSGSGIELLHHRVAVGIGHVGQHLTPQCALADGPETLLEGVEVGFAGEPGKLSAKAAQIAESKLIDDAYKAVKLQKGILQRCGSKQDFLEAADAFLMEFATLLPGL